MILIVVLVLVVILVYIKVIKPYDYWISKGVKQRKQVYLLGDSAKTFFGKESFFDLVINLYQAFPEERYMGMYETTLPTLLVRDPELIKQIAIKEFEHFTDHREIIPDGVDPLWSKNLLALKGTQWRHMRATLSPSFTSSKMRIIFNLISECAEEYLEYYKKRDATEIIELKDMFTRYTNDAIATVAFGVKCDSLNNKTNKFLAMGKQATTFDFWRFFAYNLAPGLFKFIGMKLFPQAVTDFFQNLAVSTIAAREEQGIVRPDMIHLLLEARKDKNLTEEHLTDTGFSTVQETIKADPLKKIEITDIDIAAQAFIFFFAGFETVSTALCFMGYELTINPDIQKRLQAEIDEIVRSCDGKLTYEVLTKMKYMDMVVSETLRKWPGTVGTDRMCTKTFIIEPVKSTEKQLILEPGENLLIPINGIHRDPKYFPNPEKFDPERFSDENKENIKPYTYMPFGLGPRNCIGSRLALMKVKTIFFHMLRNFDFVVVEKTDIPLKLSKSSLNLLAENGMWIGLKSRKL